MQWTVLNSAISLMGYWCAAALVDKKWCVHLSCPGVLDCNVVGLYDGSCRPTCTCLQWIQGLSSHQMCFLRLDGLRGGVSAAFSCRYGRLRMQSYGFIMMFVLFLICGVAFPQLTSSAQGLRVFQFLYFMSSFFNQVC